MKRLFIFILATFILILCFSCSENNKSDSNDTINFTFRDNKEAELMALCLSGELSAPDNLYNRILNDLNLIRSNYSINYNLLKEIEFHPPWAERCISITFDESTAKEVINNEYHDWDSLNKKYYINTIFKDYLKISKIAILYSDYRLNPHILSEYYSNLSGVEYVCPDYLVGNSSNIYPRQIDNKITYLFYYGSGDCPAGCTSKHYTYFEVVLNNVILIGDWDFSTENQPVWWSEAKKNIDLYHSW